MKKLFKIIFIICVFTSISFAQDNFEWKVIKDTEKGYRISFPGNVETDTQDVATDKGAVQMHTNSFQPEDMSTADNLVYMTAFTSYPASFFENGLATDDSKNEVLDNAVDGAVTNTKGTLISSKNIVFNGYLGRRTKIKVSEIYIIEMLTILVEFKLYLAQVIYDEGNEGNKNASYFFKSFDLIKTK